jgi:hypothetical protein
MYRMLMMVAAVLVSACLLQGQSQLPPGAASSPASGPASKPATAPTSGPATRMALPPIRHKPPRVLLIGDSISLGYFPFVKDALKDQAVVFSSGQAQGTRFVGEYLEKMILPIGGGQWDIIHFNAGLHDVKANRIVPIDEYEKNLRDIIRRLKATNVRIVWASTTPLANEQLDKDVIEYNAVAKKVMEENGIPIDDLYTLAKPQLAELQAKDGMHFQDSGYKVLAKSVTDSIRTIGRQPAGSATSRPARP